MLCENKLFPNWDEFPTSIHLLSQLRLKAEALLDTGSDHSAPSMGKEMGIVFWMLFARANA